MKSRQIAQQRKSKNFALSQEKDIGNNQEVPTSSRRMSLLQTLLASICTLPLLTCTTLVGSVKPTAQPSKGIKFHSDRFALAKWTPTESIDEEPDDDSVIPLTVYTHTEFPASLSLSSHCREKSLSPTRLSELQDEFQIGFENVQNREQKKAEWNHFHGQELRFSGSLQGTLQFVRLFSFIFREDERQCIVDVLQTSSHTWRDEDNEAWGSFAQAFEFSAWRQTP